jgi:hypothetical protein
MSNTSNLVEPQFTEYHMKLIDMAFDEYSKTITSLTFPQYLKDNMNSFVNKLNNPDKYVVAGIGKHFEYDGRKFVFIQVGIDVLKVFMIEPAANTISHNRFTDTQFSCGETVEIARIFQ